MGDSRRAVKSSPEQAAATVSKAVTRAAERLQLNQAALAEILGVSDSTASRLVSGAYLLQPTRKREWEFALLFLRLFRSLDAMLGHEHQAQIWLQDNNRALAGRPVDLIKSAEGMIRVLHYVDAARGRI
jgi:transcriptional regulator with XRE-family HTH domain